MGCISSTDVKNPKKKNNKDSNNNNSKHIQPALYKSKLDKSLTLSKVHTPLPQNKQLPSLIQNHQQQQQQKPIIYNKSSTQLLSQYDIIQTLQQSTRLQGPKLIRNKIHGGVNVLRVYQYQKIDQQRLKKYHQILRFGLFIDQEGNYLVLDQYCAGLGVGEVGMGEVGVRKVGVKEVFNEKEGERQSQMAQNNIHRQQQQQAIYNMLHQVHAIITKFHTNKTYLGNLSIFSFMKKSPYSNQIRLVAFNVQIKDNQNDQKYEMGHAHRNSFQADWQFFGYLVQYFYSNKSPIFISHKMQYVESNQQENQQQFRLISTLLKGRQVTKNQLQKLPIQKIIIKNKNIFNGYKLCQDIIRLIKCRKRRMKHKASYYSKQILQHYLKRTKKQPQDIDQQQQQTLWQLQNTYQNDLILQSALSEDNLHKLQTQRIFISIQKYIEQIDEKCQQHFINYSSAGEGFRKLKEVFLITDKRKKLQQLKELIVQIK